MIDKKQRELIHDVVQVIQTIHRLHETGGAQPMGVKLRRHAIDEIAKRETDRLRFKNIQSARHSIQDACSRRINIRIDEFDSAIKHLIGGDPSPAIKLIRAAKGTDDHIARIIELLETDHRIGLTDNADDQADENTIGLEGEPLRSMRTHRKRDLQARERKLAQAMKAGGGRLRCEVKGCGFDFFAFYGEIGQGYAHVHHLLPLAEQAKPKAPTLDELAIVCANCHAMIHRNGKSLSLQSIGEHIANARPAGQHVPATRSGRL